MDSAVYMQPASSPPLPSIERASTRPASHTSPTANVASSPFTFETSPTRQQRLLQNRNARFPAKKLSLSGLSSKLTQLIGNGENANEFDGPSRDQENKLHKSRSTGTIGKRSSLGILGEISNTARSHSLRRRTDFAIHQDNTEEPCWQSSPYAASSPYFLSKYDITSSLGVDHIQDTLNDMRLAELSYNERWAPGVTSSPELRPKARKRSLQSSYDQEEYIEHLERRLKELENDAYSPLTRRPLKEKLVAANKVNERLQQELTTLKERFETEVKRTVEEKIATEVELKRKVRDLEETLEEKEGQIREMQYQHEEKRLDTNIIETLKATIERLELEKLNMEEFNWSMSKRNEVLTNLVATGMSPPKASNAFDPASPVREKRNARPISLILPSRAPLSPSGLFLNPMSSVYSPKVLSSADISPLRLSSDREDRPQSATDPPKSYFAHQSDQSTLVGGTLYSPALPMPISRRSTMLSEASTSSINGNPHGVNLDEARLPTRRKTRRFLAGSTQLKPLLLPALTSEPTSFNSASTTSSPRSVPVTSISEPDPEETILAVDRDSQQSEDEVRVQEYPADSVSDNLNHEEGPGPAYESRQTNTQEASQQLLNDMSQSVLESTYLGLGLALLDQVTDCGLETELPEKSLDCEYTNAGFWRHPFEGHSLQSPMQAMPIPSTPQSLNAMPLPLFSPERSGDHGLLMPSRTPSEPSQREVHVRKKRKPSMDELDALSPAHKHRRHMERRPSDTSNPTLRAPFSRLEETRKTSSSFSPHKQFRAVRSCDNFVELLRRKDFAAKPLAGMTIRTLYKILSSCTGAVREARKDPFALARRVLANAWHMNWKVLGKLSWWVLGLFIQPQVNPRARPAIDWDQYDGESIAHKYCTSDGDDGDDGKQEDASHSPASQQPYIPSGKSSPCNAEVENTQELEKPGLVRSFFLWGKFSAAIMLAVGGAVIKGPSEMMKDIKTTPEPQRTIPAVRPKRRSTPCGSRHRHPQTPQRGSPNQSMPAPNDDWDDSKFDFRIDTQLDSISLLDQIQQEDHDFTLRPEWRGRRRLSSLFTPSESSFMHNAAPWHPPATGEDVSPHGLWE
ncbi:hypothetical protein H2198_010058 [Neophaeococcomyces mojaviensis]|uniref:Uncharacterized protein n=1 Tax=Neophaeococcomyces mojaviensis TaxID=3383035 RepID=A0ACC2ZSN4_9EURO|nr:hypothetical protein H2198_010058 [Knufia sp. JES_112]